MADSVKSKKPKTSPGAAPPETHEQTRRVEKDMTPSAQHHTTEPYGKSDDDARTKTQGGQRG